MFTSHKKYVIFNQIICIRQQLTEKAIYEQRKKAPPINKINHHNFKRNTHTRNGKIWIDPQPQRPMFQLTNCCCKNRKLLYSLGQSTCIILWLCCRFYLCWINRKFCIQLSIPLGKIPLMPHVLYNYLILFNNFLFSYTLRVLREKYPL